MSAAAETKSIWRKTPDAELIRARSENTLASHLDIRFEAAGPDWISASMPVDERTRQPYGVLHGGANVVLAETLAGFASAHIIDKHTQRALGLEINANHLRTVKSGRVTGTCTAVHIGRQTHVWEIRIHDEAGRLTCLCRHTVMITPQS